MHLFIPYKIQFMNLLVRKTTAFAFAVSCLTAYSANAQRAQNTFISGANMGAESQVADSTVYGGFLIKPDMTSKLIASNNLGVKYVRETQLLSKWTGAKTYSIDFWKTHKKKMLLNINNDSTPSPFPTDLVAYGNKLRSLLNVYAGTIEVAVIENEELNNSTLQGKLYHLGSLKDYINELTAAANACAEYGVPVTNGGLTNPIVASLRHYYVINNKQDSLTWLLQSMNGVSTDSTLWLRTDSLLNAYKNIPLTYVNLHWYEPVKDSTVTNGVLQAVCNYITQQTGKKVITNETGVKTTDSSLLTKLIQQWSNARVSFCIFNDANASSFGSQPLTTSAGDILANGIAFRDFVAGEKSCAESITVTPGGSLATCFGTSIVLTASAGFDNYLWSTGETSQSISVNTTDNFSVTSSLQTCTAFSNGVAVLVNRLPAKPAITPTPSPPTNICPSKSVNLSSSSAMYYSWNTGGTTKSITVKKGGNYSVTVTDVNGCKNTSDPMNVTYQGCKAPANLRVTDITPYRVTLNWDTILCALGYQYIYREKGTATWTTVQVLSGTTKYRYVYNLKPSTTYEWKILTRCRVTPDTLLSVYVAGPEFTTLAGSVAKTQNIKNTGSLEETIFPVPAKDIATLRLNYISSELMIILTDLRGKILWQSKEITDKNFSIPVSGLSPGIYMVIIKDKDRSKVLKLVKE